MTDPPRSSELKAPAVREPLDALLVRGVLADNESAVEEFAARMCAVPRVLSSLNSRAGRPLDRQGIEALTQDTLVALWRRLPTYDATIPLLTWVYRVSHLTFSTASGKRASRRTVSETHVAELDDVLQSLLHVNPNEARVIELRHFESLLFEDVAQRLEISLAETKSRYYRGRLALQENVRARLKERS